MRPVLITLSEKTIVGLIKVFVFSVVLGWAVLGVAVLMWLLPTPILQRLP